MCTYNEYLSVFMFVLCVQLNSADNIENVSKETYLLLMTNLTFIKTSKYIDGTNITLGAHYFIKEVTQNRYLRWDGNYAPFGYGLRYDGNSTQPNIDDRLYTFIVEQDENNSNLVRIKNVRTNSYISLYGATLYALSNQSHYNNTFQKIVR